jgi:anti-sigma B factor antagonist
MADDLGFEIRRVREQGATILELVGELDVYTAPQLRERIVEVINDGETCLIVDMGGVTFIDSTGIGVLVVAHRRIGEQGGWLVLRNVQRQTSRVLELTGLDHVLIIGEECPGEPVVA